MLAACANWTFDDFLTLGLSILLGVLVYSTAVQGWRLWSERQWMRLTLHD
jgi:hypothetical protein